MLTISRSAWFFAGLAACGGPPGASSPSPPSGTWHDRWVVVFSNDDQPYLLEIASSTGRMCKPTPLRHCVIFDRVTTRGDHATAEGRLAKGAMELRLAVEVERANGALTGTARTEGVEAPVVGTIVRARPATDADAEPPGTIEEEAAGAGACRTGDVTIERSEPGSIAWRARCAVEEYRCSWTRGGATRCAR